MEERVINLPRTATGGHRPYKILFLDDGQEKYLTGGLEDFIRVHKIEEPNSTFLDTMVI